MKARAAAALALQLMALLAQLAYAQDENPVEKAVGLAEYFADALKRLAYATIMVAFFLGVIHWALGRGPEWLSRAVLAAFAIAAGLWLIGQFIGG